jgi:hypothetical protein
MKRLFLLLQRHRVRICRGVTILLWCRIHRSRWNPVTRCSRCSIDGGRCADRCSCAGTTGLAKLRAFTVLCAAIDAESARACLVGTSGWGCISRAGAVCLGHGCALAVLGITRLIALWWHHAHATRRRCIHGLHMVSDLAGVGIVDDNHTGAGMVVIFGIACGNHAGQIASVCKASLDYNSTV